MDFNKQLGIYLLYDGREVIYIGRTTDRPLGRRLFEHTSDRMAARWDRFSWFGLLPVMETGALGSLPASYVGAISFVARFVIPDFPSAYKTDARQRRGPLSVTAMGRGREIA